MGKTKSVKAASIDSLQDTLKGAKGVALVSFDGLKVKDVTELRRQCRAAGITYVVAKKTLLKIALEKSGFGSVVNPRELAGGIATVFGTIDEVSAAKTIAAFAKDHPAVKFVGGLLPDGEGWQFLNAAEMTSLAKLPGKQELIGQLVQVIAAPLRGFVGVLSGNTRSLVQVLSAIRDAKSA